MLRRHEAAGSIPARRTINPRAVEQNGNYCLHVRGKGAKDRLVPVPRPYSRLRLYVEGGRPKDAVSSGAFLSNRRRPDRGDYQPPPPPFVGHLAGLARHGAESPPSAAV